MRLGGRSTRLGELLMHHGGVGCGGLLQRPLLLLLFGPVIFDQLGVIFLLLSDLKSKKEELRRSTEAGVVVLPGGYLLQLLLDTPLQLSDMAKLGGVLLGKGPARLLGCALLG